MMMTPEAFEALSALVAEDGRDTERECQRLLEGAQGYLFPEAVRSFDVVTLENRSFYGSSDYIIIANVYADSGRDRRKLALWELKSPQAIIMERDDNNNRYRPTKALVKAENQLIHYHYEAVLDGAFHRRYEVRPEDIVAGGVIMGRNDKWCAPTGDQKLAELSQQIRVQGIYKPAGLRFVTWSAILDVYRPAQEK